MPALRFKNIFDILIFLSTNTIMLTIYDFSHITADMSTYKYCTDLPGSGPKWTDVYLTLFVLILDRLLSVQSNFFLLKQLIPGILDLLQWPQTLSDLQDYTELQNANVSWKSHCIGVTLLFLEVSTYHIASHFFL